MVIYQEFLSDSEVENLTRLKCAVKWESRRCHQFRRSEPSTDKECWSETPYFWLTKIVNSFWTSWFQFCTEIDLIETQAQALFFCCCRLPNPKSCMHSIYLEDPRQNTWENDRTHFDWSAEKPGFQAVNISAPILILRDRIFCQHLHYFGCWLFEERVERVGKLTLAHPAVAGVAMGGFFGCVLTKIVRYV